MREARTVQKSALPVSFRPHPDLPRRRSGRNDTKKKRLSFPDRRSLKNTPQEINHKFPKRPNHRARTGKKAPPTGEKNIRSAVKNFSSAAKRRLLAPAAARLCSLPPSLRPRREALCPCRQTKDGGTAPPPPDGLPPPPKTHGALNALHVEKGSAPGSRPFVIRSPAQNRQTVRMGLAPDSLGNGIPSPRVPAAHPSRTFLPHSHPATAEAVRSGKPPSPVPAFSPASRPSPAGRRTQKKTMPQ